LAQPNKLHQTGTRTPLFRYRAADLAKTGIAQNVSGVRIVSVVEGVEELRSELDAALFPDLEVLKQPKIPSL